MELSKLELSMAKMGIKYPDSPWRMRSLVPAEPNTWVGGLYGYDDHLEPVFYGQELRPIKNPIEARAVYEVDRALGHSLPGIIKQILRLGFRLI